jgi:hypothetical protein
MDGSRRYPSSETGEVPSRLHHAAEIPCRTGQADGLEISRRLPRDGTRGILTSDRRGHDHPPTLGAEPAGMSAHHGSEASIEGVGNDQK